MEYVPFKNRQKIKDREQSRSIEGEGKFKRKQCRKVVKRMNGRDNCVGSGKTLLSIIL